MSIVLLFFGCFILYGKSRFFPEHFSTIGNIIKQNKQIAFLMGYLFMVFSYILFSLKLGWGTGIVTYLISVSLCYSLLVIVLTLNKRYLYIISIVIFSFITFQNIIS